MDVSTDLASHSHAAHGAAHHDGEHDHHELGWWRKYVFSTDHKVIGIQYMITGLLFLLLGFMLMMVMRWQLAYPGRSLPLLGPLIEASMGPGAMPDGKMAPEFYNSLGAMHGTIMIFLGIVPVAFAAFGNFVVPLQIGAPIPGMVTSISCSIGHKVSKGDKLVTLEAMKMYTTINSPVDGVIEEILVAVSDTVESKDLLVRLRA